MQKNSIQPSSPIQTRQFLLDNEEILYIGSATEKFNHLNLTDRTRWIALTDLGRLLIMHKHEEPLSIQSSPKALRKSFISSFIPQRTGSNTTSRNSSGILSPDKEINSQPPSPAMRRLSSRETKTNQAVICNHISSTEVPTVVSDNSASKIDDFETDDTLAHSPAATPVMRRMSSNTTKSSKVGSRKNSSVVEDVDLQTSSRTSTAMRRLSLRDAKSSTSSKAGSRKNSTGIILPFDQVDINDEDLTKGKGMFPRRKSMKESKSGTSSALASHNHSFLIEEENVYIANGIKERRTLVINQFDLLDVIISHLD